MAEGGKALVGYRQDRTAGWAKANTSIGKIVQYLYNLSDPELEDPLYDRLSFQRFVGVDFSQQIPDFTTLWRFKERIVELNLMDTLFGIANYV